MLPYESASREVLRHKGTVLPIPYENGSNKKSKANYSSKSQGGDSPLVNRNGGGSGYVVCYILTDLKPVSIKFIHSHSWREKRRCTLHHKSPGELSSLTSSAQETTKSEFSSFHRLNHVCEAKKLPTEF